MRRKREHRPAGWGYKYEKHGIWCVKYHDRGKAYRESTRTRGDDGEKAAEALLDKRYKEIAGDKLNPEAERLRVADLRKLVLDDYELKGRKSARRVRSAFGHLEDYFGRTPVPDIPRKMSAYLAARQREGAKPGTLRNEATAIRRGCTLAVKAGLLRAKPIIETVPKAPNRKGFVPAKAMTTIERNLPDHLRSYCGFLYLSGWRREKAAELEWKHVDLDSGMIEPPDGTENKEVAEKLPFHSDPRLDAIIREQWARTQAWQAERGELVPWVFWRPTKKGAKRIGDFRDSWDRAIKAAGRPDTLVHDFRRTRATLWNQAGVPVPVAMALGGWKTAKTYLDYVQTPQADLEAALQKAAAAEGVEPVRAHPRRATRPTRRGRR